MNEHGSTLLEKYYKKFRRTTIVIYSLFRNKGFLVNLKIEKNASKFAMFMEKEVSVDIDQGIHKGKMKVALNEKRKKLRGFSFSINIANFEAFL